MSVISSLVAGGGTAASPLSLQAPSSQGVARSGHVGHRHHHHRESRESQAPAGWSPEAVGQALQMQALAALQARFSFSAAPAVPVAGLSPTESADQSLAQAVGQAVQSGADADTAVADVRSTVEQALQEVARYLGGAGVPAADADAATGSVLARLDAMLSAAASGGASAVAARATLVQKQKASIEIRTQEGDVVKLSLRARTMSSAGLAVATSGDGASVGVAGVRTISSARLSIDVDGNINAEEAAAIGDVLQQVETLADQFFAGDVEQAFASAASLNINSDQLASVALQLRFRQSFSGVALVQQPAAPPASPEPAPVELPVSDAAPAPVPADAPDTAVAAAGSSGDPAAAPVSADSASGAAPAPAAAQTVQSFLARILDLASAGNQGGSVMLSARWKLDLLVAVTRTLAPAAAPTASTAEPGAGVAKLAEVVDRIGARLDTPAA